MSANQRPPIHWPVMRSQSYRLIYFGLGAALLAVLLLGVAFGSPDGGDEPTPEVLERLYPEPGSQVPGNGPLEVDLPRGYEAELWVDFRGSGSNQANWVRIPESEVSVVEATGLYSWQPAPDRIFEEWPPGNQRVRVRWDTTVGLPDSGEYDWSFRVNG